MQLWLDDQHNIVHRQKKTTLPFSQLTQTKPFPNHSHQLPAEGCCVKIVQQFQFAMLQKGYWAQH